MLVMQQSMNGILDPIGYLRLGDSQNCFLGAWDKTIVFDMLLKKKKKKKKKTRITALLHKNYGALA